MTSSKIKEGIVKSLKNVLLGTSLWGVLDITQMKRRYLIIETVRELAANDYFKDMGFNVRLLDENNFVQKIPYFNGNTEFIEKHDLTFNGENCYMAYLEYMYHNKIKHE